MNPEPIWLQVLNFFREKMPNYELYCPIKEGDRRAFWRNFPEKSLSVVHYVPFTWKKTPFNSTQIGARVKTVVKVIKRDIELELRDTLLTPHNSWKSILREKTELLETLIKNATMCEKCQVVRVPRSGINKTTGTKYVAYYCPICNDRVNTTFGTGLKSGLHKHLK